MIDINEILSKYSEHYGQFNNHLSGREIMLVKEVKIAIKEIVEKVLGQAAENALLTQYIVDLRTEQYEKEVNKQSILDTIKQIEF